VANSVDNYGFNIRISFGFERLAKLVELRSLRWRADGKSGIRQSIDSLDFSVHLLQKENNDAEQGGF
jgi:hypothetical protein